MYAKRTRSSAHADESRPMAKAHVTAARKNPEWRLVRFIYLSSLKRLRTRDRFHRRAFSAGLLAYQEMPDICSNHLLKELVFRAAHGRLDPYRLLLQSYLPSQ